MNSYLVGCDYNELNMHTPVWNLSSLGSKIYVKIPVTYCKYLISDMYDISNGASREVDIFDGKVKTDKYHPWIEIQTSILNMRSGKHIYKINFLDPITDTTCSLFISYVAQDDNPETNYIYMRDRGNTNTRDNDWKDGMYADNFYAKLSEKVEQTYGYDPLLFGEEVNFANYCSLCTLPNCNNCPYKEA